MQSTSIHSGPADAVPAVAGAGRQLVVTVNGPGEIAAWLYPLSVALKARMPDLRICVCLLPCVFSSGAERAVLDELDGIDAACTTSQSYALILRNRLPEGFSRDARTLLFHLGGEVALTRLIAWRLGCEMYAYAEQVPAARRKFARVFYNGLNALAPNAAEPAAMVGELMVDAARLRRGDVRRQADAELLIGLFPGSRAYMVGHILPFLAVAVDELAAERPELRFAMAKAEFIDEAFLRNFPVPHAPRNWRAQTLRWIEDTDGQAMLTEAGTRIAILSNSDVLARADFAVSLPGTNTGEMAASGIPMVVVLPTHLAEAAPLPGLAGHIGRLPLIGTPLKRWLALRALRGFPHLAQPNRRSGRRIVPELVGRIDPSEIVAELRRFLDADRAQLSDAVRDAMGRAGAADRLAAEVADYFGATRAG